MSKRGWLLFVALGVIWGIPYLLIKVAVREVHPATLVFLRTAIAAVVLIPASLLRRELVPAVAHWRMILVFTAVEMAIPWVLLSTAEERLPSSLSGLLIAAVPLVGIPVGLVLGTRDEPFRRRGLAGLVIGLAGVVVLLGFDISGAEVGSVLLVAAVVLGYAIGPAIVSRWLDDVPSLGVVTLACVFCTAGYAPFALDHLPSHPGGRVVASVVVLGLVCTALAFVLMFALIAEAGPIRSTLITYVNPAVAVALGVVFLGEPLTAATVVGFVLILSGSWLASQRRADTTAVVPGAAVALPASRPDSHPRHT